MIQIYADGADLASMIELNKDSRIDGFTTNPTLLKKAGVKDYASFIKEAVAHIEKPISFEVIGDSSTEIYKQTKWISSLGDNVYVKIPIISSTGESNTGVISHLSRSGYQINVTAVCSYEQIYMASRALDGVDVPSIISIFAGRIADTGKDPVPYIKYAKEIKAVTQEILWASTREVLNYNQAEEAGADIITMPYDILAKMKKMYGKSLLDVSLETSKMFYDDAVSSGYSLSCED